MAGFFFCLASLHGAGLLFLLSCNTAPYKRLQCVLCCLCSYTAHATKPRAGLYRGFSCNLSHSTARDTRPKQAAIIPPTPRWSVYTHPDGLQPIPDTTATQDAAQLNAAAYYNKVYKGAGVRPVIDPCQTVQHSADHASPAELAPAVCRSLASAAPGTGLAWHYPGTRPALCFSLAWAARNH